MESNSSFDTIKKAVTAIDWQQFEDLANAFENILQNTKYRKLLARNIPDWHILNGVSVCRCYGNKSISFIVESYDEDDAENYLFTIVNVDLKYITDQKALDAWVAGREAEDKASDILPPPG